MIYVSSVKLIPMYPISIVSVCKLLPPTKDIFTLSTSIKAATDFCMLILYSAKLNHLINNVF